MNAPTREMIAAGAQKLNELRQYRHLKDDVVAEAVWCAMDEARTKWERTKDEYISPPDA